MTLNLKDFIRDVPDFPKPGVMFRDITPMLADARAFAEAIARLDEASSGVTYTRIIGIESRGFIFGAALAQRRQCGFVPIRKPGKLPWKTASESYELEYGSDRIDIHVDALRPGQGALIIDDLLATGGTMEAALKLVRRIGGRPVGCAFVLELGFLGGRKRLDAPVHSLIRY